MAFGKVAVIGTKELVDVATLPENDKFAPGLQAYRDRQRHSRRVEGRRRGPAACRSACARLELSRLDARLDPVVTPSRVG
jgi:hypothetical protein